MILLDDKLIEENLVITKNIIETEMGLTSHFCFHSTSNNAILRIKKDDKVIGEVTKGTYFTSYNLADIELCKTDSKGNWEFTVYLLSSKEEADIKVTFDTNKMNTNVYYGDLHSHSICSGDAINTFDEIENRVIQLGNDFHAITDHNSYAMNFQYKNKKSTIEFIYGVEMTTRFGHYNFLGREVPVDKCSVKSEDDLISKIVQHRANEGYVTFNHPFSPKSRICTLPIIDKYCDFVEIWNGPWAIHNKIALKWWHKKLMEGIYLPICGGSDTHNIKDSRNYGNPVNCVIAPYNEQSLILNSIKNGHSYLLRAIKIIEIEFEDVIFGDTTNKDILAIQFKAEKNYNIHVITDKTEKIYSISDIPKIFEMRNTKFIRFEAYDDDECVFISNPIFSIKFKEDRLGVKNE